ncbi:MAG TPA: hypothetical protein VMH39_15925 [Gemmatimonadaceae bacterium]|nr:hypothetical protein [Gemmatimonadaceae bacterium]
MHPTLPDSDFRATLERPEHSAARSRAGDALAGPARPVGDPRWSRLLIVEGVSGIGKSTLIDALIRRYVADQPARKLRTLVHLTQAHTYGPLAADEDRGALTVERNLAHLDQIVSMLEWHVRSLVAERNPKFFGIVDTLHLTHCHRPGVVGWSDVAAIDRRLAALGAKMIFAHAGDQMIWDRGIAPRRDEQFMIEYAFEKWGGSLEAVHGYFVGEQRAMRSAAERTHLAHRAIAIDGPLSTYLDEAYEFWMG